MSKESARDVIDQLVRSFESLDEFAPPVRLDELDKWPSHSDQLASSPTNYRLRRQLLGLASICIAVIGAAGVWLVADSRNNDPSPAVPVDNPEAPTQASPATASPSTGNAPAPAATIAPSELPVERSIVERVASLDPWSAAQLVQVDAQYRASPAQTADLVIANELTSRDCYQQQGIDIAEFNPERLSEWEQYEQSRWELRLLRWTPGGQQRLREEGNLFWRLFADDDLAVYPHSTTPAPEQCYPAATGVTFLGGPTVWSEDQLQTTLEGGDREWQPANWAFGRLPGTEGAKTISDDCMVAAGWDQWRQSGAYQHLYVEPEVSDTEITQMNDLVDCNEQSDATEIYLTISADYVEAFRAEFSDHLQQIERERADALAKAYDVLRAAGVEPLSD